MTTIAMPLSALPTTSSNSSTTPIATASGLLALLSEPDPSLVSHALTKLLSVVDTLWHEVAEALPDLEAIAEGGGGSLLLDDDDENMGGGGDDVYDEATKRTAAALASRVFFHLEEPRQALRLALDSGDVYFNVLNPSVKDGPYVERLVNAAIGEYVKRKQIEFDGTEEEDGGEEEKKDEEEEEELDMEKLQNVVQLMFQRCYADGSYGQALGVAFESREINKVSEILDKLSSSSSKDGNDIVDILKYAMDSAHTLIPSKSFRAKALELIASSLTKVFENGGEGEVSSTAKRNAACTLVLCRQLLGDAKAVGTIIVKLIDASDSSEGDDSALLGLQLCFDIVDSGDQAFVNEVASCLPKDAASAAASVVFVLEGSTAEGGEQVEVDSDGNATSPPAVANERGVELETAETSTVKRSESTLAHFTNAHRILTGGFTSELSLSFLYKNSNSDKLLMANLKKALEERSMSRNSVLHNCAVTTHGYLNAGTTADEFLRDNLDWMKKASNW